jgi:hypothetical protein
LFFQSLLWRIIISKSFYSPTIEEEVVEKLRFSTSNEKPLDFDDFGCLLQLLIYENGFIADKFILNSKTINPVWKSFFYK